MAVRCHRLNPLFVLALGILLSRTSSIASDTCEEDSWGSEQQQPTSVLTCTNISTVDDVQILRQLLNGSSSRVVLRLRASAVGQFPDDVFEGRPIASLYVISGGLLEIPHRLLSPICGWTLQTLWITENRIAAIGDGRFLGCSKIRTLDLSANGIRTVSRRAFQGLASLQELNLQFNDIRVFAGFDGLGTLRTLLLTKNGMTVVEADALRGMDRLETLDLSYNQLQTLDAGTLKPMTIKDTTSWVPRRYLYLEGNPWNCPCTLQWLQEWLLENGFPKNDPECAAPVRGPLMTLDLCPTAYSDAPQGSITGLPILAVLTLLSCVLVTL